MSNKTIAFQRRHVEFLADWLANLPTAWCLDSATDRLAMIHEMANLLRSTNPRFDRDKFIRRATAGSEAL